jgi:hypothetical protein
MASRHADFYSGDFIYKNYVQANEILRSTGAVVRCLMQALKLTPADLDQFVLKEKAYFASLQQEPEEDQVAYRYLETLQLLEKAKCVHVLHLGLVSDEHPGTSWSSCAPTRSST